jgi:hypothetical protein
VELGRGTDVKHRGPVTSYNPILVIASASNPSNGYLAQVVEPTSGKCLVAASASAFQALDAAFEAVDGALEQLREGSTAVGQSECRQD